YRERAAIHANYSTSPHSALAHRDCAGADLDSQPRPASEARGRVIEPPHRFPDVQHSARGPYRAEVTAPVLVALPGKHSTETRDSDWTRSGGTRGRAQARRSGSRREQRPALHCPESGNAIGVGRSPDL